MNDEKETSVRVLQPEENVFFDGTTIEADNPPGSKSQSHTRGNTVYFRHIELRHTQNNWVKWLLFAVSAVAIGAFVLFIALPALMVLVAVGLVIWLVLRFMNN